MVGETMPRGIEQRFGPYVQELRDFLTTRGVPFGTADDVSGFVGRLAEQDGLAEEMGSMVRTILYQEDELLGRGEILQLLLSAVGAGGPEAAAALPQATVRGVFEFVNEALRQQRQSMFFPEDEETPNDVPSAAPPPIPRNAPGHSSISSFPTSQGPPSEAAPDPTIASKPDIWSRAMSMAGEETVPQLAVRETTPRAQPADRLRRMRHLRRLRWLFPAFAGGLMLCGLGAFLAVPALHHKGAAVGLSGFTGTVQAPTPRNACVAPMASGVSLAGLDERARWAHNLLDQKLYASALPELRDISRLDPGYPGVKLDESDALLNLKRPDDAREAVDTQLSFSECLASLPSGTLDEYCGAQYPASSVGSCRPALIHIRQEAELQAALVHLELGHRVASEGGAAAAIEDLTRESAPEPVAKHRRVAKGVKPVLSKARPRPPATEEDFAPALPQAAGSVVGKRRTTHNSKESAYSKS